MAGFSKVILYGNLTRDPEHRTTPSGLIITKFGMAISRSFKTQDGSLKEEVTFIDIDAFGRPAELIAQNFTKGKPIIVEGRLRLDQWESQTGEKRSKLVVVLENFYYAGSSRSETDGHAGTEGHATTTARYEAVTPPSRTIASNKPSAPVNSIASIEEDDVPF